MSRRSRKRQETANRISRAALTLFADRGFDDVTVAEIAESADVDPTTFYRHFGTKEAVLFADMSRREQEVSAALAGRPADEPLLDALANSARQIQDDLPIDPELDLLRAVLTDASPTLRAQMLVYRQRLVDALVQAIAQRLDVDPVTDLRPHAAATLWVAGFEWYRHRAITGSVTAPSPDHVLDDVLRTIRPIWPNLDPPD